MVHRGSQDIEEPRAKKKRDVPCDKARLVVVQGKRFGFYRLLPYYRARARAARAAAPKPVPTCALLAPAVTTAPVAEAVLVEPAPEAPATPEGCEPAAEPV